MTYEFEWWLANTIPNASAEVKAAAFAAWNARTPRPEGTALSLLQRARECVAHCVSVDDGSWAQHNLSYADLLAKIDALLPQEER